MADECNVTSGDHEYMKNQAVANLHIKENKKQQPHEITTKPPEYSIQYPVGDTNVDDKRVTFPYISTKLRAEAPPFTPDCTVVSMENPPHTFTVTAINHEYQDHCFVNVNLVNEDLIVAPDEEVLMPKHHPVFKESISNENIKLLNETPTQLFNSISPEVEVAMNASDAVPDSSPSVAIRDEIAPSQYPARSRILLGRFTFGNSTKIAVLIASIVISLILIIYVFV